MSDEEPLKVRRPALDAKLVGAVVERRASLPEPLAQLVLEIEIALDEGDQTGVRKRLYELGMAVVRYALSIGLAALDAPAGTSAPAPVADALRRAFRLTDGRWLELVRVVTAALKKSAPRAAQILEQVSSKATSDLVTSRNLFIHGGAPGDDAPSRALAVLDAARELIALPLRVVVDREASIHEIREGTPKRKGTWRKADDEAPSGLQRGCAFIVLDGKAVRVDPWLPMADGELRLIDAPHAAGRAWRCIYGETGEHLDHSDLDRAMRTLIGQDGSAPRPPSDTPGLVGRETQGALISRALREAAEGRVRIAVLTGPQGVGLSRVLAEATTAAHGFGFAVIVSAFASSDRRSAFAALRLALESSTSADLAPLREVMERFALRARIADLSSLEGELEAVEEVLVEVSRRTALVIAIDDAHWLDEQSLAVLRLLTERANRGAEGRLALVMAVRHEARMSSGLSRLLSQVDKDVGNGATRVSHEPLSEMDTRKLVDRVAPFAPTVAEYVTRGSSGLPFYVVQPLLIWVETGALEWSEGAWTPGGVAINEVPGLAELVDARLSGYFDPDGDAALIAHHVLAALAEDGSPTPVGRLLDVVEGVGLDRVLGARVVDTLCDAAIIVAHPPLGLAIHQPIVAHALAERYRARTWWPSLFRSLLHALARADETTLDFEMLARGYDELGDREASLRWYRAAVTDRMRQGAFDDARRIAGLLAERERTDEGRLRAGLCAVEASLRRGENHAAQELHASLYVPAERTLQLEWSLVGEDLALAAGRVERSDLDALVAEADAVGDVRARGLSRIVLARRRRGREGRAAIRAGLAALGEAGGMSDLRYRLLALDVELAYETREGGIEEIRACAARARGAASQLGSTWAELDAENDIGVIEADLGDADSGIARLHDVSERARAAHYGSLRRLALTNAAALESRVQRTIAALEHAQTAETEARAAGDSRFLAVALSILAELALARGDARAAHELIGECIDLRERAGDRNLAIALLRRADARAMLGMKDSARADAERALASATDSDHEDHKALARLWIGLHDFSNDEADAKDRLRTLVEDLTAIRNKLRAPTLKRLDEARSRLGIS